MTLFLCASVVKKFYHRGTKEQSLTMKLILLLFKSANCLIAKSAHYFCILTVPLSPPLFAVLVVERNVSSDLTMRTDFTGME